MVAPSRTIAITKDWCRLGGQLASLGAHDIAALLETLAHAAKSERKQALADKPGQSSASPPAAIVRPLHLAAGTLRHALVISMLDAGADLWDVWVVWGADLVGYRPNRRSQDLSHQNLRPSGGCGRLKA